MRNASVLTCANALLTTFGAAHAQDWNKSKWGPNEEIGAANYLTPGLALKAAQLVRLPSHARRPDQVDRR